jgi:pilus assembly protein Flp/PilA
VFGGIPTRTTTGARVTMFKTLSSFVANETGATAIEYSLIASLLSVAIIGVLTNVSGHLKTVFSEIAGALK